MKIIWTKDRCILEALKYNTKNSFRNNSPSAYNKSLKKKWINDICIHMNEIKKPKDYWSKERCQEEALKYKTRGEFSIKNSGYSKAWENNWLDEICTHMKYIGNHYSRCIYSYEFDDKSVYVGLTFNIEIRNGQHRRKGPVFNHINNTSLLPKFNILTEYINTDNAKIKEEEYVNFYKENGWNILNRVRTGALGGGERRWTKEKCKNEALKYSNIKDYRNNSLSYRASVRNKWLDEICTHMNRTKNHTGYWTKEKCIEESLKCASKKEFENRYPGGYASCRKNGWVKEISSHMNNRICKEKGYWTKEKCQEESIKYKMRSEFRKKSTSAYQTAINNNWINDICSHMIVYRKPIWTKELCFEEALKYTKSEFRRRSPSAYERSRKEGWLDELNHITNNKTNI